MFEPINRDRRRLLSAVTLLTAGARLGLVPPVEPAVTRTIAPLPSDNPGENQLSSLASASVWLNSPPLTATGLRGKVVLIDFWTYTCINWIRQLPYVRAWSEKYKALGLVVIGVHAPEFEFEHDLDNVRRAAKEMRVDYPVAIDNDFAIWLAFRNRYWPALYLVDTQGRTRYHHFGEGEYEQSERAIKRQLVGAGARAVGDALVSVQGQGIEAAADWASLRSPENYVGYERTEGFASDDPALDERRVYVAPARLRLNQWALSGDWTMKRQAVVLNRANGRIACRFHARDAHLVMGPTVRRTPVRFRLRVDGQPPGSAHGVDADELGNGRVDDQRLYQLIRQPEPIVDRQLEIEFLDPGVEAFAFTFG